MYILWLYVGDEFLMTTRHIRGLSGKQKVAKLIRGDSLVRENLAGTNLVPCSRGVVPVNFLDNILLYYSVLEYILP